MFWGRPEATCMRQERGRLADPCYPREHELPFQRTEPPRRGPRRRLTSRGSECDVRVRALWALRLWGKLERIAIFSSTFASCTNVPRRVRLVPLLDRSSIAWRIALAHPVDQRNSRSLGASAHGAVAAFDSGALGAPEMRVDRIPDPTITACSSRPRPSLMQHPAFNSRKFHRL